MRGVNPIVRTASRLGAAAALAAALAACSTVGGETDTAGGAKRSDSLATKLLLGNANPPPVTAPIDLAIKRQCPPIDILQGAAAYPVYDTPGSTDPFSLRYQATIGDTARECSNLGVEAGIRVGIVGRLILGPKGAPGVYRVPLRIAVLDDAEKPIYSQSRMVEVTVAPGEQLASFTHIEDNIVVPIPDNRFQGWRIVVGYDPVAAGPAERRRKG